MSRDYNVSTVKAEEPSDIEVFAVKTKEMFLKIISKFKTIVFPSIVKMMYKFNIIRTVDDEVEYEHHDEAEYALKLVNSSNHAKQATLLDLAVFTSQEIQESIIEEKTLKEMVIDFQVVKSRYFIEARSTKGNFLYEGALIELVLKNLKDFSPVLKKVYIDFFKDEVYQYHCSSFLNISSDEIYDEAWVDKVCEKLSEFNNEEIINSSYPREVLNRFKFMYMLIKIQEVKYDSITKVVKEA